MFNCINIVSKNKNRKRPAPGHSLNESSALQEENFFLDDAQMTSHENLRFYAIG
jgi:hypothetical protein